MRGWDRWKERDWKRLEEHLGLDRVVMPAPAEPPVETPTTIDPAIAQAAKSQARRPAQRIIRSSYMD
jgi:hypothetical protein